MNTTKKAVGRPATKPRPVRPEFLAMIVQPGESIGEVCRKAVRMANQKHCRICFNYQGMELEAREGDEAWSIADQWFHAQKGKAV